MMFRRSHITIFCLVLLLPLSGMAQRFEVPTSPDSLGTVIKDALYRMRSETARNIADAFEMAWYSDLGAEHQLKIYQQVQKMLDKGLKPNPHFLPYFSAIDHAINTEAIDAQKLTDYLNMSGKVIDFYERGQIVKFYRTASNFFEHRALFFGRANQLYVSEDSYSFEFVEPAMLDDYIEPLTEVAEDSGEEYVEEEFDEDYEDDEYYDEDDDYGDEDDYYADDEYYEDDDYDDEDEYNEDEHDWEDDSWNDDLEEDDSGLTAALIPETIQPILEGPIIKFEHLTLNIVTGYDSVFVRNTKGSLLMNKGVFVGEGGKMDWEMAHLAPEDVYVELDQYNFEVKTAKLITENTMLSYAEKLDDPIKGTFEFRSVRHDSSNVSFPRFTSYNNDIKINNLINDNIIYSGGFSLKGAKVYSASIMNLPARVDYIDSSGIKFTSYAKLYEFTDSTFLTKRSRVTLYNGVDSIYHPSVKISYNGANNGIIVQKEEGPYRNTPFYESFFNLNLKADIIKWQLDTTVMDISVMGARKEIPAFFESVNHFDSLDFKYMSGSFPFNPLRLVDNYAKRKGDLFYVDDLVKKYKLNTNSVKAAMQHLHQNGFVVYNDRTGEINVKQKLKHYVKSYTAKKDFDDILIKSKIDTASNATYNLEEKTMTIRGVEQLYLSHSLAVYIVPDSSEITLIGDRNFKFNGSIHAGNFEYIGKDYTFLYDSFLINLNHIDSIQLFIKNKNKPGHAGRRKQINSVLEGSDNVQDQGGITTDIQGSSGVLYINDPKNKSGREIIASYPHFDAGTGAIVRFNRKEVFGGVYGNSIYFDLPPFAIDSLNDSDPSTINFEGSFNSSGMFPVFEEKLHLMEDFSLGFDHKIPADGYNLYEGDGKIHGDIKLNKQGIRAKGKIDYLAATLESEEFIFFPDSVIGTGDYAEIREEEHGGIIFPQATLQDYSVKWLPKKDSMYITNNSDPFQFYNQTASLEGATIVSKNGVFGSGTMETRGSEIKSDRYSFQHNRFSARNSTFEIKTDNPDKPALFGDDVRLRFNLEENYADISPEVEGHAAVEFPYAQFKTSISNARWDLNEQKIRMTKPDNVSLENSYFYTTRKDLDSLRFNATDAEYDINTQELKVSGIPYIIVADAKITPENNEVLILENSKIGTLTNTTIILDTLNGYHRLYNGTINIISRNEFSGHATYEYVNAVSDTFAINMHDFHLEQQLDTVNTKTSLFNKEKGQVFTQHSVANGSVVDDDNILVSPGFYYRGDMILYANKPALKLDGYVKLDLQKEHDYDTWIKYSSSAEQQAVEIEYATATTEEGRRLEAGIHFSALDNSLYSNFLLDNKGIGDDDFFLPEGKLFFNQATNEFMIENPEKASGESYAGKVFAYNETTDDIRFEGPLTFFPPANGMNLIASGIGRGNLQTKEYAVNSFLAFDFDIPSQAYNLMAADFVDIIENLGAAEGLGDPTDLLYKLADIIGDRGAKAYEEASQQEYTPIGSFAKEVSKPLTFADVNLKWSPEFNSFYNEGKLGMSNINAVDINAAFDGFMEIKKDEGGGTMVNLFVKASADAWYFFGYENNRLMLFSSNNTFNNYISSKSNASKAKAGELVFFPADVAETLDFINRFRNNYYGIDEPYDLGSAQEEDLEGESEDGFGAVEEEPEEEEEDEDDGF